MIDVAQVNKRQVINDERNNNVKKRERKKRERFFAQVTFVAFMNNIPL